jgi:hypothetical protein
MALLIAAPTRPEGRKRWTLDLLAEAMVRLTAHERLLRETMRRRLAEDDLKQRRRDMWIPQVDGSYGARMKDMLDLYAERADPKPPVVCFATFPSARSSITRPSTSVGRHRSWPVPVLTPRKIRNHCDEVLALWRLSG